MTTNEDPADAGVPASGWDAIADALDRLYPDQEPKSLQTLVKWRNGGPDPLDGLCAWKRATPVPHWHFVTYGFSELDGKETQNATLSGYGFELTFRLACHEAEEEPPEWVFGFMQTLARYVFRSGNVFNEGDGVPLNAQMSGDPDTRIRSIAFMRDPELPTIDTPNGRVTFLQVVGLTEDEEQAAKQWRMPNLLELFAADMPLWVTDLARGSLMGQPSIRRGFEAGLARDGSSAGSIYVESLAWTQKKTFLSSATTTITLGARSAQELLTFLPLRLPFGRPFRIQGGQKRVVFEPADEDRLTITDDALTFRMKAATVPSFVSLLQPRAGSYKVPAFAGVVWKVG